MKTFSNGAGLKPGTSTVFKLALVFICAARAAAPDVKVADMQAVTSTRRDVQFTVATPFASTAEIAQRMGYQGMRLPEMDISREKFQLVVPEAYSMNAEWGLLVWISPSDAVRIPAGWEAELGKHRLLVISAYKSGNNRQVTDRFRLALDAASNVCGQFRIDHRRIYIAGFSGGARAASMLAVPYADIFKGTLCVCGVNFYRDITGPANETYPAAYTPGTLMLSLARKSRRFVLLTGEMDFNRENTKVILEKGFKRDGFNHVFYLEVPGMKHGLPGPAEFSRALDYLDGNEYPPATPPGNL
jgi:dienelactone hydrolase